MPSAETRMPRIILSLKKGDPETNLTNLASTKGVPDSVNILFTAADLFSVLSTSIACEKDLKQKNKTQQVINFLMF